MSKTVRLKDSTYKKIMEIASALQLKKKRKVSVDEAVKLAVKDFEEEELSNANIAWARAVDKKLDARDREIVENDEDILV